MVHATFYLRRTYDAPVDRVWKALTDPGAKLKWFGGTPGYMAPEQRLALDAVRARQTIPVALDRRSDVYCLGMVLFEMLGGVATGAVQIA